NLQQMTTSFAFEDWAAWSPDTFKIAFMSDRIPDTTYTARFQIYVMNSDGSNLSQLTFPDPARDGNGHVVDTTSNFHPSWSPDGARIACEQGGDRWVMDADGSNKFGITSGFWLDGLPRWRPIL